MAFIVGLWVGIHRVSWLGPALADAARTVVGPSAVAKVEDVVFGIEDGWNRFWRSEQTPVVYWAAPSFSTADVSSSSLPPVVPSEPRFRPCDVGPMDTKTSLANDGVWIAIELSGREHEPCLFKTLLHPDGHRPWSTVALVAVDLASTGLHLVAGVQEPKATNPKAKTVVRSGLVPKADHGRLIAAFNGGFKAEHGALGMQIDALTFLPAQPWGCTISRTSEDGLLIGSQNKIGDRLLGARWWRQTPPCLVEEGILAKGVLAEGNINWGKAVHGDTIIRRSAIGIDERGTTLFVGIGKATSAGSMARAMRHAGAHTVAQLDVNGPFPKFLLFERGGGQGRLIARPLCGGFPYSEQDYVEKPSARDFFYLTKRGL